MKYPWIDEYLLAKPAVTKDLQPEWNWIRYHIGGKMFAAILLDDDNRPFYINLKLEPVEGELMRQQYMDIIPGYYSNKQHWNSVLADGDIPDDLLKHWLDRSYELVLKGFSKKKQAEILNSAAAETDSKGE
ncbi:MAG: DNA-binding protein [Clostridiales bacterium]|nr:DNA-binding protein [Clostridiales bacterium]